MEKTRKRTPAFKIEVSGDSSVKENILGKLHQIRDSLRISDPGTTTATVLENVFDFWIKEHTHKEQEAMVNTYVPVAEKRENQRMFICAEDSLAKLMQVC